MYKIVFYNDEFINYEDLDIWQIILPDDIISIELDPYYANNDDPFEIVGRKAKITIIDLPQYEWLKDLQILEFPVMIYTPPELAHNPIPYCNEFFKNLVRIIDLNNKIIENLKNSIKEDSSIKINELKSKNKKLNELITSYYKL